MYKSKSNILKFKNTSLYLKTQKKLIQKFDTSEKQLRPTDQFALVQLAQTAYRKNIQDLEYTIKNRETNFNFW